MGALAVFALRGGFMGTLALALVELAWLDANVHRFDAGASAPVPAATVAPPRRAPPAVLSYETTTAAEVARPAPIPTAECVLLYATGSSELPPSAEGDLASVLDAAWDARTTVIIEGHADRRGTPLRNVDLSARRASAVAEWLVARGVDRGHVEVHAFGDTRPIGDGDAEASLRRSRRVEVRVEPGEEVR